MISPVLYRAVLALQFVGVTPTDYTQSVRMFSDLNMCERIGREMLHAAIDKDQLMRIDTAVSFCIEPGPMIDRVIEIGPDK